MKWIKYILSAFFLLPLLGFSFLWFYDGPAITLDTAGQFTYKPLESVSLNQYQKKKKYVAMSDGTQIATNIFLPATADNKKVPTIFIFTPYNRSIVLPKMKWYEKCAAKLFVGTWGPVFDAIPNRKTINTLTDNGYAIVVSDMRGTGASSGYTSAMSPQLKKDGIKMIDWIAKQEWSNGKVGMQGPSYLGWIQLAIASEKPAALKCISPDIMGSDIYTEAQRRGGILMTKWTQNFDKQLRKLNLNAYDRNNTLPVLPSEPVIDEDGDGEISDEIPFYYNGDSTLFVEENSPVYEDGATRKDQIYFNYSKEHLKDIWTTEVIDQWQYRDSKMPVYGDTLGVEHVSPGYFVPGIRKSRIPVLLSGGWFDGFNGITKLFASLQPTNPVHLVMAPRFHMPMTVTAPYKEFLNYEGEYEDQLLSLRMQFFDYYLKGTNNGFEALKPVQVYTNFKGWESYETWPPESSAGQTYYLHQNQKLTKEVSPEGKDKYQVDFSHESGYDAEGDNRWNMASTTEAVMDRTQIDEKCLVYESPTLEKDLQLTGHPIVELFLSSNQPDADLFVYLSEVDKNGQATYLAEGALRSGWHRLVSDDLQVNNQYDIKPDLPWHGFNEGGYNTDPLAEGKIISLKFDLTPLSWQIRKGHKLRISIAGADHTNFEFNPVLCPDGNIENCKETALFIHRGSDFLSRIELPVVGE